MIRRAVLAILILTARPAEGQARHHLSDRGLDSLRQDTAIDSVDALAYYRYGLGLWEKHRFDAADSAFRRALHFQPWLAGAHLALGILPVSRGDRYLNDLPGRVGTDSARALIRYALTNEAEASTLDPRLDLSPLAFLTDEQLVASTTTYTFSGSRLAGIHTTPVKAMRSAVRALIEEHPDSAYAILARILAVRRPVQTMNDQFISLYALAALRASHPEAAASGYLELAQRAGRREAVARGSLNVDWGPLSNVRGHFLLLYGMAEAEAHQPAVARAAFHEALLTDLTFYQAHGRLADLAEAEGDLGEALSERRAAIAVAPDEGRPYFDLGITLLQSGSVSAARDALLEAAARLPWDPGTQLFLFEAAMAAGDRATAQRALAALDLFAPRRNREQVAEAHQRFAAMATQ